MNYPKKLVIPASIPVVQFIIIITRDLQSLNILSKFRYKSIH